MNYTRFVFFLLGFLFVFSGGCLRSGPVSSLKKSSEVVMAMGTVVRVDICYAPSQQKELKDVYQQVWQRVSEIEKKISTFQDTSEIVAINRSYQHPVAISEETRELLDLSLRYGQLTREAFDITAGSLVELWRTAAKTGQLPTDEQIQESKGAVGRRGLRFLPNGKIELVNPLSRIDLAAIADGYAADEVARVLRARGVENFFIDVGGDIYAGGLNCARKPWQVGIRDPLREDKIIERIAVVNAGVATSGDYTQRTTIAGQKWSHIINPMTGYPAKDIASATVIAPTAMKADALSTALCVLPVGEGLALINSLGPRHAAHVMTRDQEDRLVPYHNRTFLRRVFINPRNEE